MSSIFSVEISKLSKKEVFDLLEKSLSSKKNNPLFIVTLNAAIALEGFKNKDYGKILQKGTAIIDGFGISLVSWFKKLEVGERISGVELSEEILRISSKDRLKICFVTRADGLSSKEEIKNSLEEKFSLESFNIIDTFPENKNINIPSDTEILLVGLGAPHQEIFIDNKLSSLPNLRLAMGVGGTFDFWTEKQKRAPFIFRKLGMEWFWRTIFQPDLKLKFVLYRIKKLKNSLFLFPLYALKNSKR